MAKLCKKEVYKAIEASLVVPVYYYGDFEVAKNAIKACYDGGIRSFEFANRGPKALEVFKAVAPFIAKECPGMLLGVGSISDPCSCRKFIKAGAAFVVGPQFVPSVCRVCKWKGIAYLPGCGTVSEVGRAQRAGCEVCKVFPGDVLGPKFVKGLKAPMPWSRLMVTGGVKPEKENLESWFSAGVSCVGMGSNLFPKDAIAEKKWDVIASLSSEAMSIAKSLQK